MQAVMFAHDQLKLNKANIVVAGGMESMSNAPHLILHARGGVRTGHGDLYDHMFIDGLEDAYTGRAMGAFAQETADQYGLSREEMDAFALSLVSGSRAGFVRPDQTPL